jgi:hypothetical protein
MPHEDYCKSCHRDRLFLLNGKSRLSNHLQNTPALARGLDEHENSPWSGHYRAVSTVTR